MRKLSPASHRDLAHQSPRIFQTVTLHGKMAKRPPSKDSMLKSWNDCISPLVSGVTPSTAFSTASPTTKRYSDNARGFRTMQPQLDVETKRIQGKRILSPQTSSERAGNWSALIDKTSSLKDLSKIEKRVFRDVPSESNKSPLTPSKSYYKSHPDKIHEFASHISILPCSTYREEQVRRGFSPRINQRKTLKTAVDQRISTAQVMSTFKAKSPEVEEAVAHRERERSAQKISARYLNEASRVEPIMFQPQTTTSRYHNRESDNSYLTERSINPLSRGKGLVKDENSNSICRSNATSPIRENLERINPLTSGKKIPQKRTSTPLSIYSQNQAPTGRGRSIYSYRTFASQISF